VGSWVVRIRGAWVVGCGCASAAASPWNLIRLGISRTKSPIPIHLGSAFFFPDAPCYVYIYIYIKYTY
jgi:hypothetical protein